MYAFEHGSDPFNTAGEGFRPWATIEASNNVAKNIKLEKNEGTDIDVSGNTLTNDGDGGQIKIKDNNVELYIFVGHTKISGTTFVLIPGIHHPLHPNILPKGKLIVEGNFVSNLEYGIMGDNNVVGEYIEKDNTPAANILFAV